MIETLLSGFMLRFLQSLLSAAPFILAGLLITAVLRHLMGRALTIRMFGGTSRMSLAQAWVIGMLLPVCSLGVIPVVRELRRMGLKGGTIMAFAMAAPLFNPLSVLYGLTLSEPLAILAFALCSLVVVTCVGLVWDAWIPDSSRPEPEPAAVGYGIRRMFAIGLMAAREAGGTSALYVLCGLLGVSLLGVIIPSGGLQHAMNGDNPLAPLTMSAVAVPVYATPMLAMSQLGMMFQHANSPGAAFVLLVLGAGTNLGMVWWMIREYGIRRAAAWFALLLAIVLALAYGVDRPLLPTQVDPADHTHAFDIYCRPFPVPTSGAFARSLEKLDRDTQPFEWQAGAILLGFVLSGIGLNLVDRAERLERWLERGPTGTKQFDIVVPAPVLGGIALVGLCFASVIGCYTYYPAPAEVLDEMAIVRAEALTSALAGDTVQAKYWIEIYDDWSRKLEVGTFLRHGSVSSYHHWKAQLLREQLELLKHALEHEDREEARHFVSRVGRTHLRLRTAFLEDRLDLSPQVTGTSSNP